jgi:predicted porin
MKKVLVTALLAVSGAAFADVGLYGVLDAGIATQNKGVPSDPNSSVSMTVLPASAAQQNRVTGMFNGGLTPSRWGIAGSDSDSGATFRLESSLNVPFGTVPDNRISDAYKSANGPVISQEGSADGQLFNREATVGLSGQYGEFRIGRQTTVMGDHIGAFDAVGGFFSPLAFNGGYSGAGFSAESRWDQSIKASTTLAPGLTGSAGYKFGSSTANFSAGSAYALGLDLRVNSDLKLATVYEQNRDAQLVSQGTTAGTLGITFGDTKAFALFGDYNINSRVSVKAGTEFIVTSNPSDPVYDATINTLDGYAVNSWTVNGFNDQRHQNMTWVSTTVALMPTVKTSVGLYNLHTSRYGATSATATNSDVSDATYLAANVVKSLSKHTDLYAVASYARVDGPVWAGVPNILSTGVGIRVGF